MKKFARVMLYLPPPVAKGVKQIALDQGRKANDVYIDALHSWLRSNGYRLADELVPIQFKMPPEFIQQFKQEALNRGVKLNALFEIAFEALLRNKS